MPDPKSSSRNPWAWIPSLYLAEGLPYVTVMTVAVIMYKGLGVSNTDIALYTSWLYLPWVIKPLWSPVVDILKTRRWWIWVMQILIGGGLAGVALTIQGSSFFQYSLAFFWLLAFSSATHDIAADGFYMLANNEREQALFSGVRNTFYRVATITGQGLLVMLAGYIQSHTGLPKVELLVDARPGIASTGWMKPESLALTNAGEKELRLIAWPTILKIDSQLRPEAEIANSLATAKQQNAENGFTHTRRHFAASPATDQSPSLWTRQVSDPLRGLLRRFFGPDSKSRSNLAGAICFVSLQLSKAPGKEVVVTSAFKSGDKSVSLVEGARLVFDDSNWNKSALIVLQLDANLKNSASAVFEIRSGNIPLSWATTFFLLVGMFLLFGLWHKSILPYPVNDRPAGCHDTPAFIKEFLRTFSSFFRKPKIGVLLLFLLLYRFGEAQLVKMVAPFLLDTRETGGLALTTGQVGFVYGTVGVIALLLGGLLGGFVVSRSGLKCWLWPMVLAIHLPDAVFIYLAYAQPHNLAVISAAVAVEQFGYGFGFAAYMLYMIYIARGEHRTAHYAICTGFMALGMMLPGMWSGWLQETIGYQHFFVWVMLATIPSFIVAALIPLDREFGRNRTN
jgi:PAT family beta-lactamase induction signal transducer AmpG